MHLIQFREIMRDAEVAYAIHPIVRKYLLTVEDTTKALIACAVPRAANVAQITNAWI
jgi:glucokinase